MNPDLSYERVEAEEVGQIMVFFFLAVLASDPH